MIVLKATQDKVLSVLQSVAGIVERRHTVGARKLIDILRTMPNDQTVSIESSQNKLLLKGGKSRFTLQTLPAEDFPLVQEAASFGPVFSVPQKTLKELLAQVSFAMAVHDIRYYLNGILFVAEGKQLSLVATDGHRLAFASATLSRCSLRATRPSLPSAAWSS
jgi:DNA polymerase-3 subunit beta